NQGPYDVLVATLDGKPPQRITNDGASISPAWSPDGRRLAITRTVGGNRSIFVWSADSPNLVQVSPSDVYARYSAWSPDGRRVAFAAAASRKAPSRLAIVDLTSGQVSYPGPEGVAWISWARQGPLAYSASAGAGKPQDIFVMDEGGAVRDLTNSPD